MSDGLSIITAIHNALPMNRLYWKALSENTDFPFELIIVDNHSTDGSERFFEELAAIGDPNKKVIYLRNSTNQSYSVSQNQGMRAARYDLLCFFNNDIWMPKGWFLPFVKAIAENSLLVLSPSGQEAQPYQSLSDMLKQRWKNVSLLSKVWRVVMNKSEEQRLWKALEWMYGDLQNFKSPTPRVADFSGIKGDAIIFHRNLLSRVPGIWDERVEAADWNLYLMVAKRHEEDPGVPLPRVLTESYIHHFGKYSTRIQHEPLPEPKVRFLSLEELWGVDTIRRLWWGYRLPHSPS